MAVRFSFPQMVLVALAGLACGCSHWTPPTRPGGITASDKSLAAIKHYYDTHPNNSTTFGSAREGQRLTGLDSRGMSVLVQWTVQGHPQDTHAAEYIVRWDELQGADMVVNSDSVVLAARLQPPGVVRASIPQHPSWKDAPAPAVIFRFASKSDADAFFKLFVAAAKKHGAKPDSLQLTVKSYSGSSKATAQAKSLSLPTFRCRYLGRPD